MVLVSLIFAIQDGLSRQLASTYSPLLITMIRYWFFAMFCTVLVMRMPGGLARGLRARRPVLQVARGLLLVGEILLMVAAFVQLGLVNTHAIFTIYPLLIAALSGPVLGERVGWRRWLAIGAGFCGILIVLQPGSGLFSGAALLPLGAALMFATYGLLTRLVSRDDPAVVSFFWTGISGAVAITAIGIWHWQPLAPGDWLWMAALCVTSALSHFLLIRAYEMAPASVLQPFAYTQLVFASAIGVALFGDRLAPHVVIGGAIAAGAGLFTLWRARVAAPRS
ncbi:DMT family transporter [Paracoccus jiaweipingae]|uniref:DMT family transporter n=1 Tax=unclassified Paracoccus (in: a-proteobacteria) TaxID=2688777 RepID=UPI0037B8654D